jgi:hypothetical protein
LKKLLIIGLLTTNAYASYWCRTEPVSPNGDEYIYYGPTIEDACQKSRHQCELRYGPCEPTGCGEFIDSESFSDRNCDLQL